MKKMIAMMLVAILFVACGPDREPARDTSMTNDEPTMPAGSVDETFLMEGELMEIDGQRLLVELNNQGLTWITVEDTSDLNIEIGSTIKTTIVGGIMESYPGQASGIEIEVIEAPKAQEVVSEELEEEPLYNLVNNVFKDDERNITIEYFQVEGMKGQLVQDYVNQSLYQIVDTFGADYEAVVIEAKVLRQDDYLTLVYEGKNEKVGYEIWQVMSLHMPTATVLTPDAVVSDWPMFEEAFHEAAGFDYGELEGVQVYMDHSKLVFTFVPPDDSAVRQFVGFEINENVGLFQFLFEMPAS